MKKRIIMVLIVIMCAFFCPVTANAGTNNAIFNNIDKYLQSSVESLNIPGMSVIFVDKNDILFSNTYGNCGSIDTPFIIGSMSKSFTAVSVMQLVEQGKINLDEKVSKYLPDITVGNKITIRQLLNQTSGLGVYQRLSNMKITDTYGSHKYANVNYSLLGKVIEAVSGMSYEDYVTKNIFAPLVMNHSAASLQKSNDNGLIKGYRNFFGIPISGKPDYPNKKSWSQVPAGYISSSASDMGKYLQMYLKGGENVISEESIHTVFYDNVYVKSSNPYYYGMGWVLSKANDGEPVLEHSGLVENYMSDMFILPKRGIGAVILVNTNDYLVTDNMLDSVSKSIVLMLMGKEPVKISKTEYLKTHFILDGIYLCIFIIALLQVIFLRNYKKKLKKTRAGKPLILLGIFNVILPTALLLVTHIVDTPLWVVRYYVPDLFLVLITSAVLLYVAGIIKIMILYRTIKAK